MAATLTWTRMEMLRHSKWDAILIALSLAHAAILLLLPSISVIAIGLWWNSNTISHNFIHLPFFNSRLLNRLYSMYLSLLLGIPQSLWRELHLAHHSGRPRRARSTLPMVMEGGLVLTLWGFLIALAPRFFFKVYLPGYLAGLGLCYLQGYFEHARGATSHYGLLYNLSFFNDGYHVEHHLRPGEHWTRLPEHLIPDTGKSRWPAVLRWLEVVNLELLERLVLRSKALQNFVLKKHERAFRALLPRLPEVRRVKIIGGGVFPRTALILQKLMPGVRITIIDASAENLETAKTFLNGNVELVHHFYEAAEPESADLLIIPLAFVGNRDAVYKRPPARAVLVHDWIWAKCAEGVPVSLLLLKRLNLVKQ